MPQITVSDNERETTSGQVTASEEDDYDEEAATGGVQPGWIHLLTKKKFVKIK